MDWRADACGDEGDEDSFGAGTGIPEREQHQGVRERDRKGRSHLAKQQGVVCLFGRLTTPRQPPGRSLLDAASSATPIGGSTRVHQKLDESGFTYVGRSYGVGAAVGLTDDDLTANESLLDYSYEEIGFDTSVACIYNTSSQFILVDDINSTWDAYGTLPNSGDVGPELSTYVGHSIDTVVTIGVGRNPDDPRRMLAMAAGASYRHLNATQCSMHFRPARFNVSVNLAGRNITVQPATYDNVPKIPVQKNLTQTLMRQYELISNSQTSLYISLVGNVLNKSISDYLTTHAAKSPSLEEATLRGLENSFRAMADDMLVGYASAQLMIQDDRLPVNATTTFAALRVGDDKYIYIIFAMDVVILLLVTIECLRTRGWKGMTSLDYLDPAALLLAHQQSKEDLIDNSTITLMTHDQMDDVQGVTSHPLGSRYDRLGSPDG
ncbi:hypothetical protein F5B18DRAFT_635448 [Nemania serpens]|nr:hypothetical protein F5B18DRAFT_635448 [Nemania serpens]